MLAFVAAIAALPAGAVRASAPDLTLTASSATVVPGAQVTLTAAMPVVGAGTVSQEIVQTIDPAKVKLTSVSDISYPSGWVLSYSTDGTTFSPTTPANASAWGLVRAVKATGNINSQGTEGGFQIATGTATGTPVSITPGNITASGTGDGFQAFFDPARSRVMLVTLPETTPVNELSETAATMTSEVGVALAPVVVNGVDRASDVEALVAAGRVMDDDFGAAARFRATRCTVHSREIERLNTLLGNSPIELPHVPTAGLTARDVERLARILTEQVS